MRITIKCTLIKQTDPEPATSVSTAARYSNHGYSGYYGYSGRFSKAEGVRNSNPRQLDRVVTAPLHADSGSVQSDPSAKVTYNPVPRGSTTEVSNLPDYKNTGILDSNQADSKNTGILDSNQEVAVPSPECVDTLNNNIAMVIGGFCGGVIFVVIVGGVVLQLKKVIIYMSVITVTKLS